MTIEVLNSIKQNLFEGLLVLIKQDDFIKIHGSSSYLFNFLYLKNSNYILDFIDSLRWNELLNNPNLKTSEEIAEYIIQMFLDDINEKKINFGKHLFFLTNILVAVKFSLNLIDLELTLKALEEFLMAHPQAVENIGIITENSIEMSLSLIENKNIILNKLSSMPTGIVVVFEGDLNVYTITFKYFFLENKIGYISITF